ncbi:MAG: hydroxymethylglutaryl-CoA reductase [Spirochaetes bacterium]|nr:MAG: hydroxymethylglutaryl-CoA reductase [Spirochaetota bacterium]
MNDHIPRSKDDDYAAPIIRARQEFVKEKTGAAFKHVDKYSIDPGTLRGNVESFLGTAQVPLGLAGPLLVDGEYAQGEFYVPMATTEGTLVASYNRGMKLAHACGGVRTTIVDDAMNRAPVFMFDDAREAKKFNAWLDENYEAIKREAEKTTSVGKLKGLERYAVGKLFFVRFNFTTGDAAGQNMVGKATFAACEWIRASYPAVRHYNLSGNIDTDKKTSFINTLNTRGKRVIAEINLRADLISGLAKFPAGELLRQRNITNTGAILAGSNNNGMHSANGITAVFIATGQDAANVAESSAALVYSDQAPGDSSYYFSITIPSLIVGTYGGGTGLATQRECLEMLGCYGAGKVNKFAEIVAATVLCGELSLLSAVLAGDWVSSHEKMGRNR